MNNSVSFECECEKQEQEQRQEQTLPFVQDDKGKVTRGSPHSTLAFRLALTLKLTPTLTLTRSLRSFRRAMAHGVVFHPVAVDFEVD